jgi:hypothetical protein
MKLAETELSDLDCVAGITTLPIVFRISST